MDIGFHFSWEYTWGSNCWTEISRAIPLPAYVSRETDLLQKLAHPSVGAEKSPIRHLQSGNPGKPVMWFGPVPEVGGPGGDPVVFVPGHVGRAENQKHQGPRAGEDECPNSEGERGFTLLPSCSLWALSGFNICFKFFSFRYPWKGTPPKYCGIFLVLCCLNENKCIGLRMWGPSAQANATCGERLGFLHRESMEGTESRQHH